MVPQTRSPISRSLLSPSALALPLKLLPHHLPPLPIHMVDTVDTVQPLVAALALDPTASGLVTVTHLPPPGPLRMAMSLSRLPRSSRLSPIPLLLTAKFGPQPTARTPVPQLPRLLLQPVTFTRSSSVDQESFSSIPLTLPLSPVIPSSSNCKLC